MSVLNDGFCMCCICIHTVQAVLVSVCVHVLDKRERGACQTTGPGCGWFASLAGLSEENLGCAGETHTTAGPRQHTTQRRPGYTAEQSR